MLPRRAFLLGSFAGFLEVARTVPACAALPPISLERHERAMRLAIEQGRRIPPIRSAR